MSRTPQANLWWTASGGSRILFSALPHVRVAPQSRVQGGKALKRAIVKGPLKLLVKDRWKPLRQTPGF